MGSFTAVAGDAVAHTGLGEPPCLSGYNYRDRDLFSAPRLVNSSSGETWPAPTPPGTSGRSGFLRAAVSAPSAGRSAAELSTHQHFCWGGGNRTAGTPRRNRQVIITMASKHVGLFVLFQLLALNVVSQTSAFPTPTPASTDGELKPIVEFSSQSAGWWSSDCLGDFIKCHKVVHNGSLYLSTWLLKC